MATFETIKQEIQSWYPDYKFTEPELTEAATRLIRFFTIGVQIIQEQKNKTPSFTSETRSDNNQ